MEKFIGIHLIIGVILSIVVWAQRHNLKINHPYMAALSIIVVWPITVGIHLGLTVKHQYYIRKNRKEKDEQSD